VIERHATAVRGLVFLAAVFAVIAAPFLARASEPDPSGLLGSWLAPSEKIAIELYRCEEYLCGKIIWVIKPYRNNGEFKRDKHNPDPALRHRGYCGIEVVRGLREKSNRVWRGGTFYDAKKGNSYNLDIALRDYGRLELRGYIGIRLFGKAEVWTRPDPDLTLACVPDPRS